MQQLDRPFAVGDRIRYTSVEERPEVRCPYCQASSSQDAREQGQQRILGHGLDRLLGSVGYIIAIEPAPAVPNPTEQCVVCASWVDRPTWFDEANIKVKFVHALWHQGVWAFPSELSYLAEQEYQRLTAHGPQRWPAMYDTCPFCQGPKAKVSKQCHTCYSSHPKSTGQNRNILSGPSGEDLILRLRFLCGGLPRSRIARILGMSVTWVKIKEQRGLTRLGVPYHLWRDGTQTNKDGRADLRAAVTEVITMTTVLSTHGE